MEIIFFIIIVIFGCISTFITYPLSNGDEGYHLSRAYEIFSLNNPESMREDILRNYEIQAISSTDLDIYAFNNHILKDVAEDGVSFRLPSNNNCILNVNIFHLPAAIGVLIARLIYPSYGFMLCLSRIFNLFFYASCTALIIKHSDIGKSNLFMLFTVPLLQKIASPSYDVYSYVAFFAYVVNLFAIAKIKNIENITKKQIIYTLFTIILILFAKSNYIFALLGLGLVFINFYLRKINLRAKYILIILAVISFVVILLIVNNNFNLRNYIRVFFDNYLNMAIAGRRGKELFSVVSTILPNFFNIIWFIILFIVTLSENNYNWNRIFSYGCVLIFFVNWIGIYSAYYLILNYPTTFFDDLSGRYLHPFLIFLLPIVQRIGYRYNIQIPKKDIKKIVIVLTILIMIIYLLIVYYRGYVIGVVPTWNT